MRVAVILLAFVLILSSTGIAFQNEPEGFRGLKWGDPPTEDMVFHYMIGHTDSTWTCPNDKMAIGEVYLRSIFYEFYHSKFMLVRIFFSHKKNYDLLERILRVRYGPTTKELLFFLSWYGPNSFVRLTHDEKYDGFLEIGSIVILNEVVREADEKAAEKAAEDF